MVAMIEVHNANTGRNEIIPEDWLGDGVLDGGKWERVVPVTAADAADRPTEKSTKADIQKYADDLGVDLGDASTKADMLAALDELAPNRAPDGTAPVFPESNPGVQLVAGDVDTEPTIPMYRSDYIDPNTDTTAVSDEAPAAGDEEN